MKTALRIRRWSFIYPYLLSSSVFFLSIHIHKGRDVVSGGGKRRLTIQHNGIQVYIINKVRQVSSTIKGERNSDEHYGRLAEDAPPSKEQRKLEKSRYHTRGIRISQTARHLAKGKQNITSGKVLEKNTRDALEWVNRKRHLPQILTQLQRYPS